MSTRQGTHLEHVALTGFLMICGGGAYPKKSSGAKKLLRLSPPHRVQSPEVPFCYNREGKKQKPRPWSMVAWLMEHTISEAAEILKIPRTTFSSRVKKLKEYLMQSQFKNYF